MKRPGICHFLFATLVFFSMGFQCRKGDYPEPKIDYEFAEKLTLTPYKKVYALNDTIWVQFQTSDRSLFDKLTNSRISTDTSFLSMTFHYHRRYPIGTATEFFSSATVDNGVDVSFTPLYSWYNVLTFKTNCSDNRYYFKIGFVPKKTGVYSIERASNLVNCPAKIRDQNAGLSFTFDLADCNKDVWLAIPPASRGGELGHTDVSIDKKEMFVFKVE